MHLLVCGVNGSKRKEGVDYDRVRRRPPPRRREQPCRRRCLGRRKVPEDYTIVGQGVDVFSNDDWGSPISNYPRILTLLNDCESFERDPPVELLNNTLRNLGVFNTVEGIVEDDGNLLEQLLAPHLYIDDIFWDGDGPGCSGYIRTAFLSLDGTKEVCRRLAAVEKALLGWYEFSG